MQSLRPLPRFKRLLAALALAQAALACGAQALTPIRFQHDWRIDGTVSIYEVAQAKGYFTQEGLAVTVDAGSGSGATVNRLASGAYDMGQGDLTSFMEFRNSNPELGGRVKAVFQLWSEQPGAVLALRKSGFRSPADLRGKKIASPPGDGGRKLFPLVAREAGLNADKDIAWISVEPALREQLLVRGDADAITGFTFALINLNRLGVKQEDVTVLRYSDFGAKAPGAAILVSTAFAKDRPEAVKGFLRAITRALKDTIADPAQAIRLVKKREPLIDETLELKRLEMIIADGYGSQHARTNGIGGIDPAAFAKAVKEIAGAYGFKSTPKLEEVFDPQYLPPVQARQVFAR